jgi:hypothetical protein
MSAFIPNDEQKQCITKLNTFIENHIPFSKILINGSAGTGKTTILIASIIMYVAKQIIDNYEVVKNAVNNNKLEDLTCINHFIISAPTNKAKDVLISKYNIYLNNLCDDIHVNLYILNEVVNKKIDFLTVSQVLSINRVINEMGEEEFTKGNEKKIAEKYNKSLFDNTIIIIDECSMLDTNTTKLLGIIRCPTIYIGDYCQLPPVNEILSPVFNMEAGVNIEIIRLTKVERCKNNITEIANMLRDKIYEVVPDFNLVRHKITDMVFYQKKMDKWLDVYVADIKKKQTEIDTFMRTTKNNNIESSIGLGQSVNDTMALAWTNKCCAELNTKIRLKLFLDNVCNVSAGADTDKYEGIEDISEHFLVSGDKLLVKAPYYKYGNRIYSSSIIYVAGMKKTQYNPLSFKEWCELGMMMQEQKTSATNDINLESILGDDNITTPQNKNSNKPNSNKPNVKKSLMEYFGVVDNTVVNSATPGELEQQRILEEGKELARHRIIFYKYHSLKVVVGLGLYDFNDEVSKKYNKICNGFNLLDIKNDETESNREAKYKKWHRMVSTLLFGCPNDNVMCKKCMFFIKKFQAQMNKSCYVADMNDATESLRLDMYLTDLAIFTTSSKLIINEVPILDMNVKNKLETINVIKNIVRSSYEVKMILTKQDEHELKAINKSLNEDDASNSGTQKYITMSQMFGHYLNHVITSAYLDVDYGYALTVHKSQGSTYDDVYVEYNNLQANKKDTEKYKLLYTAITRCANKLHVYY